MNKELLKSIWTIFGIVIWLFLFTKTFYEWTQGKQPDNFTVMMILLIDISLKCKFAKRQQFLLLPTRELRDEFYDNFKDLIEIAKPLL